MSCELWLAKFDGRMKEFSAGRTQGLALSVKVRVQTGCFHREHSPVAYDIIDAYLDKQQREPVEFRLEPHETGPEFLVWMAYGTAVVSMVTALTSLITAVISARSQGIMRGDRSNSSLDIIVRYMSIHGLTEISLLTVHPDSQFLKGELKGALTSALRSISVSSNKTPPLTAAVVFAADEQGYRDWVAQNPLGFVMVSNSPPKPNYTTVHRADCYTINPSARPDVDYWTHQYVKICAGTLAEIQAWAEATWGAETKLHLCGHCERSGRV